MSKKFLFKTFSFLAILSIMIMAIGAPLSAAAAPLVEDNASTINDTLSTGPAAINYTGGAAHLLH